MFDYNFSFLILVIVWKLFSIFRNDDFDLDPAGPNATKAGVFP
jgi:hypothetical protein